jgi:hypothetical protein
MSPVSKEILNALTTGINAEIASYVFYLEASKKKGAAEIKSILEQLALEEKRHFQILERQHNSLIKTRSARAPRSRGFSTSPTGSKWRRSSCSTVRPKRLRAKKRRRSSRNWPGSSRATCARLTRCARSTPDFPSITHLWLVDVLVHQHDLSSQTGLLAHEDVRQPQAKRGRRGRLPPTTTLDARGRTPTTNALRRVLSRVRRRRTRDVTWRTKS